MENITFYEQINLFLKKKKKAKETLSLHTQASTYVRKSYAFVCRHRPAHATRVSKTYERQVFYINVEV